MATRATIPGQSGEQCSAVWEKDLVRDEEDSAWRCWTWAFSALITL